MLTALVNKNLPNIFINELNKHMNVIKIPESVTFDSPISSHPDVLIGKINNTFFVNENESALLEALEKLNLEVIKTKASFSNTYPNDCHHNFFCIDNHIFCNSKVLPQEIFEFANVNKYDIINVKQGYAKCSSAIINNKVITADRNISTTLQKVGYETCLISQGGIKLSPYDYGFVGGASCYFNNTLFFFGNHQNLKDYKTIERFCHENKIEIVSFNCPLEDFGGAIIINM